MSNLEINELLLDQLNLYSTGRHNWRREAFGTAVPVGTQKILIRGHPLNWYEANHKHSEWELYLSYDRTLGR